MHRRIEEGWANGYPFLVCQLGAELVGYAYGRQFRPRSAYRYSIETSVYVKHNNVGQKIGTTLYEKLLSEIREKDFHAVIAGISLPNDASVFFHENFGFEKVAHFREVGHKFGRWIDVGYWELLLNKTWVCHV
jgi:phosphinothricin acetyltransferase